MKMRGFEIVKEEMRKTKGEITLPTRGSKVSAGYDFYIPFNIKMNSEWNTIPTGIKCRIDKDWCLVEMPKSGLGFKFRSKLANTLGLIDSDYYNNESNEGHIWICLKNEGDKEVKIKRGEHFAQGVFTKFLKVDNDTTVTSRTGGFGSTNKGEN